MIHRNGRFIFECEYDDMGMFSEGLVYVAKDDNYQYLDEMGRNRFTSSFEDAYDFHDGRALVQVSGLQAYIDVYGTYIVPPAYESISSFGDSLFLFEDDGYMGIMNRMAKTVLEAEFDYIGSLSNGVAVASRDDEVLYIDESGSIVAKEFEVFPNFQTKGEFKDGAAIAVKDEEYGRINPAGKTITEFEYENLGAGSSAIPYQLEGKWGIMSLTNKKIVSKRYQSLDLVSETYAVAQLNDTIGVITLDGGVDVPFLFDRVKYISDQVFVVEDFEGKQGIYRNGNVIADVEYDEIGSFNDDFLFLNKAGKLLYYSISENKLIEYKEESE